MSKVNRTTAGLLFFAGTVLAQNLSIDDALRMAAEGRLAEAETALQALTVQAPDDGDLRYRLGLVLLKEKKLDQAAGELTRATTLDPASVFAWLALGDVRLRQGNHADAARTAKRAESLAGTSPVAWKALALLQQRLGDDAGQVRSLRSAILFVPEERGLHIRLTNLLIEHRNADSALTVATAALNRFKTDAELFRLRGMALYGLGRKPEAIDAFLAAMDAAPTDEVVYASIETLIEDAGDRLPQLTQRLRRFRELRPASPLGPFLLSLASSSPEEKQTLVREAIATDPSFWPAYFELHRLLRGKGDSLQAIQALNETLRLNPNHEHAHFALAELYGEAGDLEKAREHRLQHDRLRAGAAEDERRRAAHTQRLPVGTQ
jgi:tetratricopeptide (TPR) repeat protein